MVASRIPNRRLGPKSKTPASSDVEPIVMLGTGLAASVRSTLTVNPVESREPARTCGVVRKAAP